MVSPHPHRDLAVINVAGFFRSLGVGFMGVVLGIYLYRTGLSSFSMGLTVAAGLVGSALATVLVSFAADRFGRKRYLITLSLLNAVGGLVLALSPSLPVLLLTALISMLNATGADRSPSYVLDQAIIPGLAPDNRRTWNLAWYNVSLDGAGSLGALGSALPLVLHDKFGLSVLGSYRTLFCFYSAICGIIAALYSFLSPAIEVANPRDVFGLGARLAPQTKSALRKLTALFSLDAFGGGFLTDALLAYWFFRRFGIPEYDLGLVFFAVHVLNAASHLAAACLARRIGLVNTMVFTHLPSSLFLVAVPFAPSFRWAVALFLCREALVEMDVPTRQSYVAALVPPEARTLASGITNLVRNLFWAAGSATAGLAMQAFAFSAPLLVGGGAKITYDLLLYRSFRGIKAPEEMPPPPKTQDAQLS